MAQSPSNMKALAYAVAVHVVVIVLLVIGFTWRQEPPGGAKPKPDVVKARVVDNEQVQKEVERIKAEDQRKRKEEAEKKQKAAEAEKRRRLEDQRAAELKRKQAEDKKQRAEQQRAAEETRRKEAEAGLREQLAAEEKERAAARAKRVSTEVERYKVLIQQKVERNWVRPGAADKGLECVVRVRLVPGGEVIEAKVVRGSGNPAFDRSVENAVYKATPLPLPADLQLFEEFRDLEFTFKPPKA